MQRAIEFLLKSQANAESRLQELGQRLDTRLLDSNQLSNSRLEEATPQFAHPSKRIDSLLELIRQSLADLTKVVNNFVKF